MSNGQSMEGNLSSFIHIFAQDFLTGRDIPMMNENAISNILIDVDFLEGELKRIGRSHLATAFTELRLVSYNDSGWQQTLIALEQTTSIVVGGTVQQYLVPANRHASYAAVKPKRLQALLEKLARFGANQRDAVSRELGEKRRREAEAVGRVFPGESR